MQTDVGPFSVCSGGEGLQVVQMLEMDEPSSAGRRQLLLLLVASVQLQ